MYHINKNFHTFKKNDQLIKVLNNLKKYSFKTSRLILFIVDNKNRCVGTVTDGDIRRFISTRNNLHEKIYNISRKNFIYINENDSENKILRSFELLINKRGKYLSIPILDNENKIVGLLDYDQYRSYILAKKKIIRARIPARVSFSGGGTDFSSYLNYDDSQILTSTINKFSTVSLLFRSDEKVNIINRPIKSFVKLNHYNEIKNQKRDLIIETLKMIKPEFGFDLEILSDFDIGTGLGGSSSVCVAVLAVFNEADPKNKMDLNSLCNIAYQIERIKLGIKGGWQDFFSTSYGGFSWIELDKKDILVNSLKVQESYVNELEHNLLLFKVGKSRKSSLIQKKNFKNKYSKTNVLKMKKISKEMKKYLLTGKIKKFGDLLDESWSLKKIISPYSSNSKIDKIYNLAKKNGALGGKLLGAGQSGYLLLYVSPAYQETIKKKLKKLDAKYEKLRFISTGLKVWITEK